MQEKFNIKTFAARFLTFLMALILVLVIMPVSSTAADTGTATAQANALNELGLFQGTDSGYELGRAPTRTESIVMLIRLLGQENAALSGNWAHPFTDVPPWADSYVGYAYQKGYTNGISSDKFGAYDRASAASYITFVLRSLGYSDAEGGDFSWSSPFGLAAAAGIMPPGVNTSNFLRGDVVLVSWAALDAKLKGKSETLADKMISENVFSSDSFSSAKKTASPGQSDAPKPDGSDLPVTDYSQAENILSNTAAKVDATYVAEGYVRIAYTGGSTAKIKTIITAPDGIQYTYNLSNSGEYEVFPLSGGDGTYSIGVYVNKYDTKYSTVFSTKVSVTLKNQFAPFLIPNQYVNYTSSSKAVGLAADITKSCKSDLDKVKIVYSYVVSNITYDYDRAANVQSGYLPDIDDVLAKKSGICFDYAALMTAMLRTQGIPTKLVVGYAGSVYHAWISTYTEETGWVNNIIYFDGNNWKLMDPTFASSGHEAYTADSSHYSAKFYY